MKTTSGSDDMDSALRRALIATLIDNYEPDFRAFIGRKGVPACDNDEVLNTFWISLLKIPLDKLSIKPLLYCRLLQVIRDHWRGQNRKKRKMLEFHDQPPEVAQAPVRPEPRSAEEEDWLMRVFFDEYRTNLSEQEKVVLFKGMRGHCLDALALKMNLTPKGIRVVLRRAVRKFRTDLNDGRPSNQAKPAAGSASSPKTLKSRKTTVN